MARYSADEIKALRQTLTDWHTPECVARIVADANRHLGSSDFFNQPGLQFLREMWVGAELAAARKLPRLRLHQSPHEPPDFVVDTGSAEEEFEVTEADDPGRRRGDEYRSTEFAIEHHSEEDETRLLLSGADWISRAYSRKLEKGCFQSFHLVVYVPQSLLWTKPPLVHSFIRAKLPKGAGHFKSLWVIWAEYAYWFHPRRGVFKIPESAGD